MTEKPKPSIPDQNSTIKMAVTPIPKAEAWDIQKRLESLQAENKRLKDTISQMVILSLEANDKFEALQSKLDMVITLCERLKGKGFIEPQGILDLLK